MVLCCCLLKPPLKLLELLKPPKLLKPLKPPRLLKLRVEAPELQLEAGGEEGVVRDTDSL